MYENEMKEYDKVCKHIIKFEEFDNLKLCFLGKKIWGKCT